MSYIKFAINIIWIFIFRRLFIVRGNWKRRNKQKKPKIPKKPKKEVYYVYVTANINLKELSVLHYDGGFRVDRSEMRWHFNSIKLFSAK